LGDGTYCGIFAVIYSLAILLNKGIEYKCATQGTVKRVLKPGSK